MFTKFKQLSKKIIQYISCWCFYAFQNFELKAMRLLCKPPNKLTNMDLKQNLNRIHFIVKLRVFSVELLFWNNQMIT